MKKSLFILASVFVLHTNAQNETRANKPNQPGDYLFFRGDTLAGFDLKSTIYEATTLLSLPKEQRVYVYRKELAFVRSKYNMPVPVVINANNTVERKTGNNAVYTTGCSNLDFETGSFTNWTGAIGYNSNSSATLTVTTNGISTLGVSAAETSCSFHTVVSNATGNDPFGFFPAVDVGGGSYAVRIGGENINNGEGGITGGCPMEDPSGNEFSNGEVLQNTIAITSQNDLITYKYAVIIDDGGHPAGTQPYFSIQVLDGTGTVIPALSTYYTATAGVPPTGFVTSTVTSSFNGTSPFYLPWTTGSFNLSAYVGTTITLQITAAGCCYGGHFAYGYFDATCGPAGISPF